MTATDASTAILNALTTVQNLYATGDPGSSLVTFPAAVVSLPELAWQTFSTSLPTDATFYIYVVVDADGYALSALEAVISEVVAALWSVPNASVTDAKPGTFNSGGSDLPAYVLTTEVAL